MKILDSIKQLFAKPTPALHPVTPLTPEPEPDELHVPEMSPAAARAALHGEHPPLLLDVREPYEWRQVRIPNTRHMPMNSVPNHLAELPADARVRVLAWRATVGISRGSNDAGDPVAFTVRRDDLLAVGESSGPDGARWVLFAGETFDEDYQRKLRVRSYTRRPTESDIYDFLYNVVPEWGIDMLALEEPKFNGVVDEAVWQDVVGAPRVQQWLL